jgi:hypothetical protein
MQEISSSAGAQQAVVVVNEQDVLSGKSKDAFHHGKEYTAITTTAIATTTKKENQNK